MGPIVKSFYLIGLDSVNVWNLPNAQPKWRFNLLGWASFTVDRPIYLMRAHLIIPIQQNVKTFLQIFNLKTCWYVIGFTKGTNLGYQLLHAQLIVMTVIDANGLLMKNDWNSHYSNRSPKYTLLIKHRHGYLGNGS